MAEKRVIELDIQTNEKSLKSQLREAQAEVQKLSEKFGATSQEAVNAAKKAAELKDAIEDAKNLTDAFNPDAKFNSLSSSIGGVLNGFQAYEGALGLIGVESESLQKTMLKVQSAMALSQGLQGLMEAKDSFKQLGAVAVNALKGVRGALIATGIGALVVALGTIVAYWDDIKAAVSGVSSEQEQLNIQTEKNVIIENEKLSSLNSQDNILKLQGLSEKQILQIKIKQIDATIAATEEQIKQNQITAKAQEEATLRNFKIAKQVIAAITKVALIPVTAMVAQVDLLIKGANYVSEVLGNGKLIDLEPLKEANKYFDKLAEGGAKLLFDPEEVKAEGDKLKKETEKQLEELKNTRAGYQLTIREINKQDAEKTLNLEKEYNEKLRAYYDALEAERQANIVNAKDKELQEIDNKYEELYAKADAANQSDKELIKKHQEEVLAINQKYALIEAEMMAKAKLEANKLRIQQEEQFQAQIEEIDESNFQARLKKSMSEQEYEIELVRQKYFTLEEEAKGNAEKLAIIEEAKQAEIDKIEKTYAEKAKASQQARVDLILKYAQTFGQAMSNLNSLLNANDEERLKNVKKGSKEEEDIKRKMFERDKKLRIVQTIIDTASNVVQSIRNGGGIPTGIPFGIAAAAMGALQIATISKAKFDGGGDQVQSPSAGGGAMAPNFNVIGSSGVNQLAQIQQQPTRAYVVSGDVANGLSLERNRLQNASF